MHMTDRERFESKVLRSDDGCWLWNGYCNPHGYGTFSVRRPEGSWTKVYAHRRAYELSVGPIPAGLQIDHLCRNPSCVRPDHLDAVTGAENGRRGREVNLPRQFCRRGHDTFISGRYKRGKCIACVREKDRARYGNRPNNGEKTHCPAGHPYSGPNLRLVRNGEGVGRRCRSCDNARQREFKERRKSARVAL